MLLATADAAGNCDVSPRGGPPGFVAVLDELRLALPDLSGNNRLDSYRNVVENPHAGLLFVVPGKDETVRVNGAAVLTDAPDVLDRCTAELQRPKLALVLADAPDLIEMRATMEELPDPDALRRGLAASYAADLAAD